MHSLIARRWSGRAFDPSRAIDSQTLGPYAHCPAGFSRERACEVFRTPREYAPITAGAIAYRGTLSVLPQDRQTKEPSPSH